MDKVNLTSYNKKIAERLQTILDLTELELVGLATFLGLSTDIFYSILSGRRKMSVKVANSIGSSLNFDGSIIFNLNTPIPISIKSSQGLIKFKEDNKNNIHFFYNTWSEQKMSALIKAKLVEPGFFLEEKYTWEVTNELKKLQYRQNSDLVSKQLKYLSQVGVISKRKGPIKRRDGSYGERLVDVYFKEKS